MTINLKGNIINLDIPLVMGIINITSDSFYDKSRHLKTKNICTTIQDMFDNGADIIDIGAMSSRPGAKIISEKEEIKRLIPIFEIIKSDFSNNFFSIDTIRASIAEKSINNYGFSMINDISGGEFDNKMFSTIANYQVPYVIMHMRGTPENMQQKTNYKSLIEEIIFYFSKKVQKLNNLNVNDIIIDPGFGFSKTIDQNYELLKNFDKFKIFNLPILAGLSRKSMIWKQLDTSVNESLNGTTVLNTIALQNGANILRVHDVKEAKETISLLNKTINSR